jgi:Ca2+-binding EF-hand superfamily protein
LDKNHDGGIDANELASGLKKFHASMGIESDAELESMLLVVGGSDASGKASLNTTELARAMVMYAKSIGTNLTKFLSSI